MGKTTISPAVGGIDPQTGENLAERYSQYQQMMMPDDVPVIEGAVPDLATPSERMVGQTPVDAPSLEGEIPEAMRAQPTQAPEDPTQEIMRLQEIANMQRLKERQRLAARGTDPNQYAYEGMSDLEGMPVTTESGAFANKLMSAEDQAIGERIPLTDQYNYRDPRTIAALKEKSNKLRVRAKGYPDAALGTIQSYAIDGYDSLNQTQYRPTSTMQGSLQDNTGTVSALNLLQTQANVNENEIINAYVEETLALAAMTTRQRTADEDLPPEIKAAREAELGDNTPIESEEDILNIMQGKDKTVVQDDSYDNPILVDDYKQQIGSRFKKNLRNKKAVAGIPTESALDGISDKSLGNLLFSSQMEQGLLKAVTTPFGNAVVLSDKGKRNYQASRKIDLITRQNADVKGGGTYTDAPFDPNEDKAKLYHSFQALSDLRRKDHAYFNTGIPWSVVKPVRRANAIMGRARYSTEPHKMAGFALINALAFNSQDPNISGKARNLISQGKKKEEKLIRNGRTPEEIERDLQNEATHLIKTVNAYLDDYDNGLSATIYAVPSNYNGRSYYEDFFKNWQGNNYARALTSNGKRGKYVYNAERDGVKGIKTALTKGNEGNLKQMAETLVKKGLKKDGWNSLTAKDNLLFNLMTIQGILDSTLDVDNMSFYEQLTSMTYDKFTRYSKIAKNLNKIYKSIGAINADGTLNSNRIRNIIPAQNPESLAAVLVQGRPRGGVVDVNKFTPDEMEAINFVLDNSSRKNLGQIIGALEDASRFVDAAERGAGNFMMTHLVAQDMKMAGPTKLALMIGNQDVVVRSGIDVELSAEVDRMEAFKKLDNNRVLFGKQAADTMQQPYYQEQILKDGVYSDAYDQEAVANAWANAFIEYTNDRGWAAALAKNPKMTSVYGKPEMMHQDAMYIFIEEEGKLLADDMMTYYDNKDALVNDLAKIVEFTLYQEKGRDLAVFMKQATNFLGMFGLNMIYKGYHGNTWELGAYKDVETDEMGVALTEGGDEISLKTFERVKDFAAAAKPSRKSKFNPITGKIEETYYFPPKGSAISNAALAQIGQAAEAEYMVALINDTNPNVNDTGFIANVFDNIVGDSFSAPKHAFAAASYEGEAYKALWYNPFFAIVEGYNQRMMELSKFIAKKIKDKEKIDIGLNGDFAGVLVQGDNIYADIKRAKERGDWDNPDKIFFRRKLEELKKIIDAMGYQPDDGRNRDSILLDPQDLFKTIEVSNRNDIRAPKKISKPVKVIKAFDYFYQLQDVIDKFSEGGDYHKDYYNLMRRAKAARGSKTDMPQSFYMMPGKM